MTQTTAFYGGSCGIVEVSSNNVDWTDISGSINTVEPSERTLKTAEVYTQQGAYSIITGGKGEPLEIAFTGIYSDSAGEGYSTVKALLACGATLYIRYGPGSGPLFISGKALLSGFSEPMQSAEDPQALQWGFKIRTATLTATGWPETVWAATTEFGVYKTLDFVPAWGSGQPTWSTDNGGLPDMTQARYTLERFDYSGNDAQDQALLLYDSTAVTRTVYKRDNGGNWASSLTEAQATTLTGAGGTVRLWDVMYDGTILYAAAARENVAFDANIYILRSLDNGANWASFASVDANSLTPFLAVRNVVSLRVTSAEIAFTTSNGGNGYVLYSSNSGAAFSITATLGNSLWSAYDFLYSDFIYVSGNGANGPDLVRVNKGTMALTVLLDAYDLGPRNNDALWRENANHMRILKTSQLWVTTDAWATLEDTTPTVYSPTMARLFAPQLPDNIFLSQSIPVVGTPHVIYAMLGEGGTPQPRGGNDPVTGVDSIPYASGSICAGGLAVL